MMRWSALGLLLVAACKAEPGAHAFDAERVVSAATTNGATPMYLAASDGSEILSWVSAPEGGSNGMLHVQRTSADGTVRSSVLQDPLGGIEPHGEAPPQLAAGADGALYALYTVGKDVGARYPASALRFARSADGGATWSEPVSVNEGNEFGSHSFHSIIADAQGTVYASWLNNDPTGPGVWLRASRDGGRTWEPAHPVSTDPACPCCRTALALGQDGALYLAWRAILPGDIRDIVVTVSHDGGSTWAAPVRPHQDDWVFPGCPHAGPSLKVDPRGGVHLAWWTGREGGAGVWYGFSSDGGDSWQVTPIDTTAHHPAHLQLAVTDTLVLAVWDGGADQTPGVFLATTDRGTSGFGPRLRLSDPRVAATFPVLGLLGDSVTVAWSQTGDSLYRALLEANREPEGPHERMALPRVGQQEIVARRASITRVRPR